MIVQHKLAMFMKFFQFMSELAFRKLTKLLHCGGENFFTIRKCLLEKDSLNAWTPIGHTDLSLGCMDFVLKVWHNVSRRKLKFLVTHVDEHYRVVTSCHSKSLNFTRDKWMSTFLACRMNKFYVRHHLRLTPTPLLSPRALTQTENWTQFREKLSLRPTPRPCWPHKRKTEERCHSA